MSTRKATLVDAEAQTESLPQDKQKSSYDWNKSESNEGGSIVEQVKEAAESALRQTGFVYEETSGLYYDYNSGYYYDAVCISNSAYDERYPMKYAHSDKYNKDYSVYRNSYCIILYSLRVLCSIVYLIYSIEQ